MSTILAILTGSLGTLMLTKIFEYFSEERVFRRDLKRQFFTKKLEVADNAVKFCVSKVNTHSQFQVSIDLLLNHGHVIMVKSLADVFVKRIRQLDDLEHSQLNALRLYFKLNVPPEYTLNLNKFANLLSEFLKMYETILQTESKITLDEQNDDVKKLLSLLGEIRECSQMEEDRFNYISSFICKEFEPYNLMEKKIKIVEDN